MCLIAVAIGASRSYPLVIAANRDESFDRPTLPLQRWQSPSGIGILSGRDLRGGGTWLGLSESGRAAFLTNVRAMPGPVAPKSRGELVLRWLDGHMTTAEFTAELTPSDYGGFNLVIGDQASQSWTWLSNSASPQALAAGGAASQDGWISSALLPGIYGLSNAALDTPWPKTLALRAELSAAMQQLDSGGSQADVEAALWAALASRQQADASALPHTGLPPAFEQSLSSAFVHAPERHYGTRCSTLVMAHASPKDSDAAHLRILEKTFAPGELPAADHPVIHQELRWPARKAA